MTRLLSVLFLHIVMASYGQNQLAVGADSLFIIGNYTQAINAYAQVGTPTARLQIARAYTAKGNVEKAIAEYGALLLLDTSMQIPQFELGKLLLKHNDAQTARIQFSRLVDMGPDNPEYHYYLAEAHRQTDQPSSSLVSYKNALEQDSTHLKSLFQLGKYFTIKRETQQALHYVDKGLQYVENDVALVNLKALIYYNNDQFRAAIPWFERVLALGEHKAYVYEKLAHCYYKEWDVDRAVATYKELLKLNDTNPHYYYALAETFEKGKQLDSAETYVRKGMQLQRPILAKGFLALSGLARERNDLKSALDHLKNAHKEEPNNAFILYSLCALADRYYEDPKIALRYYVDYLKRFGAKKTFYTEMAQKRIRELREQIHFSEE